MRLVKQVRSKIRRLFNLILIQRVRSKLQNENFTIISQNCIGGVFYSDMRCQFMSPTINLCIPEPDFVNLVLNLEHYLTSELILWDGDSYPVGLLGGDIRIYFMHYDNCEDAKRCWNRRKARINWDKILILATDRNGFTDEVWEQWKTIKYPKILFTTNEKYVQDDETLFCPRYRTQDFVPDLIPKREFYHQGKLIKYVNCLGKGRRK